MAADQLKQKLITRNESVERLYTYYVSQQFLVNRRYQRKLVWTIEEKRTFIDSLRRAYPVPLILVAEINHEGAERYEIIDGMQRLNAVMSFIEGEFDLDGYYFDLERMAETKLLLDQKKLVQREPKLSSEACVKIVQYNVPLSIYPEADHSQVDEVFRRVNAYGRHLSRQELRVAGVTSQFSQVVRKIASMIRGDVSAKEKLYLDAMKAISITSKDLPYGLNVDTIFWVTNNILTRDYIRQSRDEELIADMLGYVLLTPKLSSSSEIIDSYFGFSIGGNGTSRTDDIEAAINRIGTTQLTNQYMAVHEATRNIIASSGKKFSDLMLKDGGQRFPRYFQAVFLGLWDLLVNEQMVIKDFGKAAKALDGIGLRLNIGGGGGRYSSADRESNSDLIAGILRKSCAKRKSDDPALSSWTTEFENLLSQSQTEQALYDFKQGFRYLDKKMEFDESAFDKVFKTLAAMANHGRESCGYVVIGVADNPSTTGRIKEIFSVEPIRVRGFDVIGIDHEAANLPKKLDGYYQQLMQRLAASPMSEWAKAQVAREARLMQYFDRHLVILKIEGGNEPCSYDGKYYERHGPNIAEVKQSQYFQLFKRFLGE